MSKLNQRKVRILEDILVVKDIVIVLFYRFHQNIMLGNLDHCTN